MLKHQNISKFHCNLDRGDLVLFLRDIVINFYHDEILCSKIWSINKNVQEFWNISRNERELSNIFEVCSVLINV